MKDEEVGYIYNALIEYGNKLDKYNENLSKIIDTFLIQMFSKYSEKTRFNDYIIQVAFDSKKKMEDAKDFIIRYLLYDEKDISQLAEKIDEEKELKRDEERKERKTKYSEAIEKVNTLNEEYKALKKAKEEDDKAFQKKTDIIQQKLVKQEKKVGKDIEDYNKNRGLFDFGETDRKIKNVTENFQVWREGKIGTLKNEWQLKKKRDETFNKDIEAKQKERDEWEIITKNLKKEDEKETYFLPEEEFTSDKYVDLNNNLSFFNDPFIEEDFWLFSLIFPKKYIQNNFNEKKEINPFLEKINLIKKNKKYPKIISKIDRLKEERIKNTNKLDENQLKELDDEIKAELINVYNNKLDVNDIVNENNIDEAGLNRINMTYEKLRNMDNNLLDDDIIDVDKNDKEKQGNFLQQKKFDTKSNREDEKEIIEVEKNSNNIIKDNDDSKSDINDLYNIHT